MAHFSILALPLTSHVNAIFPLGRELVRRGNQVTVIGIADMAAAAESAGLSFRPVAEAEVPFGASREFSKNVGRSSWLHKLKIAYGHLDFANLMLRDVPAVIKQAGIDLLIVDQAHYEGGSIADACGIPYVTVSTDIPQLTDYDIPPLIFDWIYRPSAPFRLRNRLGYAFFHSLSKAVRDRIGEYRQEAGLPPLRSFDSLFSPYAQISHLPPELDYPRTAPPAILHYTGPFHTDSTREPVEFSYDRLDGRPLAYCAFGSILNNLDQVFEAVSAACRKLDLQLVLSLGGVNSTSIGSKIDPSNIVVPFAPQLEILKRAAIMISHGGVNSALEALNNGVPLLLVPMANDAFGSAARVKWTGAGRLLRSSAVGTERLTSEIGAVLNDPDYRRNAQRLRKCIQAAGGVGRAADIIQTVADSSRPPA